MAIGWPVLISGLEQLRLNRRLQHLSTSARISLRNHPIPKHFATLSQWPAPVTRSPFKLLTR
ncbi:hypothetical protein ACJ5XR_000939 [Enterobacter hormaechei]